MKLTAAAVILEKRAAFLWARIESAKQAGRRLTYDEAEHGALRCVLDSVERLLARHHPLGDQDSPTQPQTDDQ